jgi:exonuclease SbcD
MQPQTTMHDPAQVIRDFLIQVRSDEPIEAELALIGSALADLCCKEIEA